MNEPWDRLLLKTQSLKAAIAASEAVQGLGLVNAYIVAVMGDNGKFYVLHGADQKLERAKTLDHLNKAIQATAEERWPLNQPFAPIMPCYVCNGTKRLYPGGPPCGHCD